MLAYTVGPSLRLQLEVWFIPQLCRVESNKCKTTAINQLHVYLTTLLVFIIIIIGSLQAGGKYRQQGRNYIVEDGDIIFFKFNAGAGLTAKKK